MTRAAGAGAVALMAAAASLALVPTGSESASARAARPSALPTAAARCLPAPFRFRGIWYRPRTLGRMRLRVERRLGLATAPACPSPSAGRARRTERVTVFRLVGIAPRVGVGRRSFPWVVWVAVGRCTRARQPVALVRCLRAAKESGGPGPIGPPPAFVVAAGIETKLAFGPSCWFRAGSGICIDTVAPELRDDIPHIPVRPGQIVRFRLGFTPRSLQLALRTATAFELFELAPRREVAWQVPRRFAAPPGGLLAVLDATSASRTPSGGTVTYLVTFIRQSSARPPA